ncbi:hypothetical protein ACFL42_00740 [Candidatus Omnitrophota bacterium]
MVKKLAKKRYCSMCGGEFRLSFAGVKCPRCSGTLILKNVYVEAEDPDKKKENEDDAQSGAGHGSKDLLIIIGSIVGALALFLLLLFGISRIM